MQALITGGLESYEQQLKPARERFDNSYGLAKLMSPETPPELVELFLIHFCANGVGMTEPVEGWIRRAGERCLQVGLSELGQALMRHAKHEAGHHVMMIRDTRSLVARWNARGGPQLDAERLLLSPRLASVQRYVDLHEVAIAGPTPFGQIAIEYEIEMMSVRVGPPMIGRCVDRLGGDILKCLSFIEDHVELDVGHTQLNLRQLKHLLQHHPDFLGSLVSYGQAALEAYAGFMDECMSIAEASFERMGAPSRRVNEPA
jgi:hypothetical protein